MAKVTGLYTLEGLNDRVTADSGERTTQVISIKGVPERLVVPVTI